MGIAQSFLGELDQEGATTRRVLERVPADKLGWKPHEKSMTLGALAAHVAGIPGMIAGMSQPAVFEMPTDYMPPTPKSTAELLAAHDESVANAKKIVGAYADGQLMEKWTWQAGGRPLMSMPRIGLLRAVMLNHWYHHRGQLSVYLRLLDVPVPSIYGPSADENPFR
jgi:uncharacterized damage-inducible protein DinB